MIEEPPLLTVRRSDKRPTPSQVSALRDVPTGFLTDAMEGRGALSPDIRPLSPGVLPAHMCGVALTCLSGPADILALLGALTELQAGDVLVMATGNWRECAAVGDRVLGMMKNADAAGFVTDGLARDVEGINEVGLPVFCTGLSPNSPYEKGPGEIGTPVVVGGCQIETGDIIVSDDSGIVVVPYARIDEVIDRVAQIRELEVTLDGRVSDGLRVPDHIAELMRSDKIKRI